MKQLNTGVQQSALDDFLNEVFLLSAVKHKNLVKLKGCCLRETQRLLVYEFVENNDLAYLLLGQHLHHYNNFVVQDTLISCTHLQTLTTNSGKHSNHI